MSIVKFTPAKKDKLLLSVLQDRQIDYLSGKIIKQTEKETHIVVCVPAAENQLRIVPAKNVKDGATFEIL